MSLQYLKSQRGQKLIVDNYLFEKYANAKNDPFTSYWRCQDRQICKQKLTLTNGQYDASSIQHDHADHSSIIAQTLNKEKLKNAVLEQPSKGMKRVYDEVVRKQVASSRNPDETVANLPTFKEYGRTMHRVKSSLLTKDPKNLADMQLTGDWIETINKQQFVAINDGTSQRIVVFSTNDFAQRLANSEMIFADGTFKSVPKLFAQLYTFHAKYDEQMITLAYCLLPNKSAATYER
ncbi:uncharacterized protein B4U80_11224, partial [Leptotrombidium deliense]